jgi:hypothetical protein
MPRNQSVRGATNPNGWLAIQIGMGLALVALGLVAVSQRRATQRRRRPLRDYSRRSGFPLGVEASRGAASDAPIPADMLTPELLRPFTQAIR